MSCKECLHFDACQSWAEGFGFGEDEEVCPHFIDCSKRFAMYGPCKVGDTVYALRNDVGRYTSAVICKVDAIHFGIGGGGYMRLRPIIQEWVGNRSITYKYAFSSIGRRVFLSAADADAFIEQKRT